MLPEIWYWQTAVSFDIKQINLILDAPIVGTEVDLQCFAIKIVAAESKFANKIDFGIWKYSKSNNKNSRGIEWWCHS